MGLLNNIKELFIGFAEGLNTPWWAEITTVEPRCIYYFGPFRTSFEARAAYPGYVEDLNSEEAQGVSVVIKQCKPDQLTIFGE